MRLSLRKSDPGFSHQAFGAKALLDGKEVQDCFTADEEQGIVYCYFRNEFGEFVLSDEGDSAKEIELRGEVKIILPGGSSSDE